MERISTGVSGLDNIMAGGLPSGHLYLIEGDPGTGKTTLGLQFLREGVLQGETVLYVTLSESERELRQVAKTHGWDLSGIEIFQLLPMEDSLKLEEQYTVLYPGEVELSETLKAILKRVEAVKPSRVVFDSLSELRLLSREPVRFRRQLLALKQYFGVRDCTVVMLDDRTGDSEGRDILSIAHGAIRFENLSREYGTKRRRLEVLKLRGVQFREGYHDYNIRQGGLVIYPRLIAAEHIRSFPDGAAASDIPELDALLSGGLHRGTSTLLMGPAGAGKSTVALRYASAAAERGEQVYFAMFDETLTTMLTRMDGLGMKLKPLLDNGKLRIEVIEPAELSPGHFMAEIQRHVEQAGTRVVVIDSLNGLLAAMPGEQHLTIQLHELLAYLNNQGVATVMVLAQYGILGQGMSTPVDVSYLADTIMLFRYFEHAGAVKQALSIVKKRSGKHERTIRELKLGPGIQVGEPLSDFQGVLTGVPSYNGAASPLIKGAHRGSNS